MKKCNLTSKCLCANKHAKSKQSRYKYLLFLCCFILTLTFAFPYGFGTLFNYVGSSNTTTISEVDALSKSSYTNVSSKNDNVLFNQSDVNKGVNKDVLDDLLTLVDSVKAYNNTNNLTFDFDSNSNQKGYQFKTSSSSHYFIKLFGGTTGFYKYGWQPVYVTEDNGTTYLTLWMVDCYNTSTQYHSSYANYQNSNVRSVLTTQAGTLFNDYGNLSEFIARPSEIFWQTDSSFGTSDPRTTGKGGQGNANNETYCQANGLIGAYTDVTGNKDYLWLPSCYECHSNATSYENTASVTTGLWGLDTDSKKPWDGSSYAWLRSGYSSNSLGARRVNYVGGVNYDYVDGYYGVRPALHLNLTSLNAACGGSVLVNASDTATLCSPSGEQSLGVGVTPTYNTDNGGTWNAISSDGEKPTKDAKNLYYKFTLNNETYNITSLKLSWTDGGSAITLTNGANATITGFFTYSFSIDSGGTWAKLSLTNITMPESGDKTITIGKIYGTAKSYNITTSAGAGTTISSPTSGSSVAHGTSVTVSASINNASDYTNLVISVYKTGDTSTPVAVSNNTFTMPAYPVTITTSATQIDYSIKFYTITSVDNYNNETVRATSSNNLLQTNSVHYNCSTTMPSNPTLTGYTFSRWTTNGTDTVTNETKFTSNTNVYAVYTIQKFTVTVAVDNVNNYGTVSASSVANVPYGTTITTNNNTVTINGTTVTATPSTATAEYSYAFSSWTNGTATVTGAMTVTANFTRTGQPYTVTFDYGSGYGYSQSVAYGSKLSQPSAISRIGYTISNAWYKNSDYTSEWNFVSDTMPAYDLTLYGGWTPNSYTINYNANGGSEATASTNKTYGTNVALASNNFTAPNGKVFVGWNTKSDGTGESFAPNQTLNYDLTSENGGTVTLYAQWGDESATLYYINVEIVIANDVTLYHNLIFTLSDGTKLYNFGMVTKQDGYNCTFAVKHNVVMNWNIVGDGTFDTVTVNGDSDFVVSKNSASGTIQYSGDNTAINTAPTLTITLSKAGA